MESRGDNEVLGGGNLLISMARGCWGSLRQQKCQGREVWGATEAAPGFPQVKSCGYGMRGGQSRGG